MAHRDTLPSPTLATSIQTLTGINPAKCYVCGKCSAGCPMAEEMGLKTHEIMRLIQLDARDRLFEHDAIWLCLTCETCSSRCPNNNDPARVIDALRELALKRDPARVPRRIRAFHRSFLEQIRTHGRVHEVGLTAAYKLRSGALLDDLTAAPGMFFRGKLALLPKRVEHPEEIGRIFDACLNAGPTAEEEK